MGVEEGKEKREKNNNKKKKNNETKLALEVVSRWEEYTQFAWRNALRYVWRWTGIGGIREPHLCHQNKIQSEIKREGIIAKEQACCCTWPWSMMRRLSGAMDRERTTYN